MRVYYKCDNNPLLHRKSVYTVVQYMDTVTWSLFLTCLIIWLLVFLPRVSEENLNTDTGSVQTEQCEAWCKVTCKGLKTSDM